LKAGVAFEYSGGSRGWVGDVPQVRLDPARLAALGWTARLDSDGAVRQAVRALLAGAPQGSGR
jgi:UDP-glucose 4-epimerase